ncbi:hypothetical protein [Roseibium sp.]|uniref:hypothetical protein n=1 Tax=Roseibium sp. TaxID=1936156 RepID=UPI003D122AFA
MTNTTYLNWLRREVREIDATSAALLVKNAKAYVQSTHRWTRIDDALLSAADRVIASCERLASAALAIASSEKQKLEIEKLIEAASTDLEALIRECERCGPSNMATACGDASPQSSNI